MGNIWSYFYPEKFSSHLTLTDMPDVVLSEILRGLNFFEIQSTRKVCHRLRDFIDDNGINSIAFQISITVGTGSIKIGYDLLDVEYRRGDQGCLIDYGRIPTYDSGYAMYYKKKWKFLESEDFMETALRDLSLILKNCKPNIGEFGIRKKKNEAEPFGIETENMFTELLEFIGDILQSRSNLLKVEVISIDSLDQSEIMSILPFIDPKYLAEIVFGERQELSDKKLELNEIVELEQWKQASDLIISEVADFELFSQKIEQFYQISVYQQDVPVQALTSLKKSMIQYPNLQIINVCYQRSYEHPSFGEPYIDEDNDENEIWFFSIQNSEKILMISHYSKDFYFSKIEMAEVPENAVIQP